MERGNGNSEANTGELHAHGLVCLKAPNTEGPEVQSATTATAIATAITFTNGCLPLVQPPRLSIATPSIRGIGQRAGVRFAAEESVGALPCTPPRKHRLRLAATWLARKCSTARATSYWRTLSNGTATTTDAVNLGNFDATYSDFTEYQDLSGSDGGMNGTNTTGENLDNDTIVLGNAVHAASEGTDTVRAGTGDETLYLALGNSYVIHVELDSLQDASDAGITQEPIRSRLPHRLRTKQLTISHRRLAEFNNEWCNARGRAHLRALRRAAGNQSMPSTGVYQ